MSLGLFVAVLLLQAPPQAAPPGATPIPAPPTIDSLIAKARDRYSHCATYRDHARERVGFRDEPFKSSGDVHVIAIARPDRFRFERGEFTRWQEIGKETLWREHDERRRWSRHAGAPTAVLPDERTGILFEAGLYGTWIAPLLGVPEFWGQLDGDPLKDAGQVGPVVGEMLGGIDCWKVNLEFHGDHVAIWITGDGAIRRVVTESDDGFRFRKELVLSPEFDVPLDPAELALSPPRTAGVKPSTIMHVLEILSFVTMGTIGVMLGLRLQKTGRPFTVANHLFAWFAVIVGAAELLGRFVDDTDVVFTSGLMSIVVLGAVGLGALPILKHVRRGFGFHVVGVDQSTFLTALRAVAAGLGLHATISAATPKVLIDRRSFDVASRPTWSMWGLTTREKASRALLERIRSFISECFESLALPTRRGAGLRIIAWSSAMIVGAVVIGGLLMSLLDFS